MILKNKKIKKAAKILAIALAATTLTGCSLFARDDAPKGGLVIEKDAKNLEQGAYTHLMENNMENFILQNETFQTQLQTLKEALQM